MFDEWQATALDGSESRSVAVPGRPASFGGADGVRYETVFEDPREPGDDIAVLELRGVYAHSEIEISGRRLGGSGPVEHDSYFRPVRIPFEPEPETRLVVTCHAPADRFGGLHDTEMVPESDAVPGIWWGVSLESYSLPYVDSIDAEPELTPNGANLRLRTTVVADDETDERITYSVRPAGDLQTRGMMQRGAVHTEHAGETVVEHTVEVPDPSLWWPRELGEQNLYELRAKLDGDEHSITTGICNTAFRDGRLHVNGEPVTIRGVNLLTDDESDIDRALDLNANLVRAHAHVLPDGVYDQCNQEGVLVWQDLPLTGPGGFNVERGTEIGAALARQYGRNPSLAVYGIHDDPVDAFASGLGGGFLDTLRLRWRAWQSSYDDGPATRIADALPETRATVPVIGGPGVGSTVASYYPGWDYGEPSDIAMLLERYPASTVAEFGAGALPDDAPETVSGAAGFDRSKHDRHVSGGIDESQQYQATLLRTVIEQFRRNRTDAITFALRDTDSAGMGVFGRDGSRKAAADVVKQAYRPVQAFLATPDSTQSEIVVVNETPRGRTVELDWEAGERRDSARLTIDAAGRSKTGPVEIPAEADTVVLSLTVGDQTVQTEYAQ